MAGLNNIRLKPSHWILGLLCILTFSPFLSVRGLNKTRIIAEETEQSGRLLGFLKPKNDYTDINLGFEIPVPQVNIPYPIYKIGYQNLFPFKTWLTLDPLHIGQALYKLASLAYEVASRLWQIFRNTIDVFKLWGAFVALNKHHKHTGWPSTTFEGEDTWRR